MPTPYQNRTLLTMSNNTCITQTFERLEKRFHKLYQRKAHLYHYLDYIEKDHFESARHSLADLIQDYASIETNGRPMAGQ